MRAIINANLPGAKLQLMSPEGPEQQRRAPAHETPKQHNTKLDSDGMLWQQPHSQHHAAEKRLDAQHGCSAWMLSNTRTAQLNAHNLQQAGGHEA